MNAENFSQYLQDPSLLHQVSYEELKTVALQYPYCQPLRLLLLKKCLLDNRANWRETLAQVASRSVDRRLLFERVKALGGTTEAVDNFLMAEEYLELKSLEDLKEEALPLPNEPDKNVLFEFGTTEDKRSDVPPSASSVPAVHLPEDAPYPTDASEEDRAQSPQQLQRWKAQQLQHIASELNSATNKPTPPMAEPQHQLFTHKLLPNAILTAVAIDSVAEKARLSPFNAPRSSRMAPDTPLHQGIPRPRPKTSFTSWIAQFQPPNIKNQLSDIMESEQSEISKKQQKQDVTNIAEQSVTRHPDVISETLAKLLARQGEKEQAVEIYERLMLVFPKKSTYFAHQIEQLKKKE